MSASKVIAKFVCTSVEESPASQVEPYERVRMSAVYGEGQANKEWSKNTPYGVVDMVISNPGAFGAFVMGQEYFLAFDPVRSPVSAAAALQNLVANVKKAA